MRYTKLAGPVSFRVQTPYRIVLQHEYYNSDYDYHYNDD